MSKSLADFAVKHAIKKGATYAEARYEKSSGSGLVFKNGVPQISGFDEEEGIGARLVYHGAMQFVSTDVMDKKSVARVVEMGVKMAKACAHLMKDPVELAAEEAIEDRYVVKEKKSISSFDVKDKFELMRDVESELSDLGLKIPARYFSLSDAALEKYFVNSTGTKVDARLPMVGFTYMITVQNGSKTMQKHQEFARTSGYEALSEWNLLEKAAGTARNLDLVMKNGVRLPKGELDLVCGPEVVGIAVHESVGHPQEADRILGREAAQAGESFLGPDSIGVRIGSDAVTVMDDPTIPHSAGFYLYDDEGVRARPKYLINGGAVTEFLQNKESAWQMNTMSNGSSRAMDYSTEPIIRMSNTFIPPGEMSEEELLSGVKKGVYVKSFMEWNIDDKRFNQRYVSAEAYLVENGEVTKPVKRVTLETTTPEFWGAVDAVANNLEYFAGTCGKGEPMQGVPVSMGGPSIRLRSIRLGD